MQVSAFYSLYGHDLSGALDALDGGDTGRDTVPDTSVAGQSGGDLKVTKTDPVHHGIYLRDQSSDDKVRRYAMELVDHQDYDGRSEKGDLHGGAAGVPDRGNKHPAISYHNTFETGGCDGIPRIPAKGDQSPGKRDIDDDLDRAPVYPDAGRRDR